MPLTASTTEVIVSDGTWTHVATGGIVLVTCSAYPRYAFTASATAPLETMEGHPFKHIGHGYMRHDAELSDGLRYWVKVQEGIPVTITASAPAP